MTLNHVNEILVNDILIFRLKKKAPIPNFNIQVWTVDNYKRCASSERDRIFGVIRNGLFHYVED